MSRPVTSVEASRASVEADFRKELAELLKRWNAEICISDYGDRDRSDLRAIVMIDGIYNEQDETVRPFTEFDLGTWLNGSV